MISRIFAEFANQNAFPANFPKKAAKNRANLKGDSSKFNKFVPFLIIPAHGALLPSRAHHRATLTGTKKSRHTTMVCLDNKIVVEKAKRPPYISVE